MVENIVLRNMTTNEVLELDKVTTPYYILDSATWGEVESTQHSYKYVNQIGVYVTSTSLETREVSITGWVIATSVNQMAERKKMLNRFVNPQQTMELKYQDYVLEFLPNRSIMYSATVAENNEVMCKFKIEGMSPNPLFRANNESKVSVATMLGKFHFPLVINKEEQKPPQLMFGLRQPSLIVSVYNSGTVSTGMKIVFEATGTIVNPSLINVRTQEYFKINKTLVDGEIVTVDTIVGEKKIVGSFNGEEFNYFKYRDLDSVWLQLEMGDNVFRYNADEGIDNLEVYIYFYNRYLEVQG